MRSAAARSAPIVAQAPPQARARRAPPCGAGPADGSAHRRSTPCAARPHRPDPRRALTPGRTRGRSRARRRSPATRRSTSSRSGPERAGQRLGEVPPQLLERAHGKTAKTSAAVSGRVAPAPSRAPGSPAQRARPRRRSSRRRRTRACRAPRSRRGCRRPRRRARQPGLDGATADPASWSQRRARRCGAAACSLRSRPQDGRAGRPSTSPAPGARGTARGRPARARRTVTYGTRVRRSPRPTPRRSRPTAGVQHVGAVDVRQRAAGRRGRCRRRTLRAGVDAARAARRRRGRDTLGPEHDGTASDARTTAGHGAGRRPGRRDAAAARAVEPLVPDVEQAAGRAARRACRSGVRLRGDDDELGLGGSQRRARPAPQRLLESDRRVSASPGRRTSALRVASSPRSTSSSTTCRVRTARGRRDGAGRRRAARRADQHQVAARWRASRPPGARRGPPSCGPAPAPARAAVPARSSACTVAAERVPGPHAARRRRADSQARQRGRVQRAGGDERPARRRSRGRAG